MAKNSPPVRQTVWWFLRGAVLATSAVLAASAQQPIHLPEAAEPVPGATAATDDAAPTFVVPQSRLPLRLTIIAYGDQRFHDPANTTVADPAMRQALVKKIAQEHPDAVLMSGDVPYKGTDWADYERYTTETAVWRAEHLRVYPAMGNHELSGGAEKGLANWWRQFPELTGRRWYSVRLGNRVEMIQLDSMSPLTPGSPQIAWLGKQLAALPTGVDFVLLDLHHPPVADIQLHIEVDHNPRPNEIALRDFLTATAPTLHAALVVIAGHIHNYERAEFGGITYLVSGGGGAHPYFVERTPQDLYTDPNFPIFHYIRFTLEAHELKATMYKVEDPTAPVPTWQAKDNFVIHAKEGSAVRAIDPAQLASPAAPHKPTPQPLPTPAPTTHTQSPAPIHLP